MYLSRRKYCKILCDVVCRPHCRRRVLCDMTFTCPPLPWEIHRFGGLNSIVIVYTSIIIICYYNICYIFYYDKCVMCEYSEYIYYVNNEYIYIYLRLTYYIRIYIHIFVYAPPALSSPLTPIRTHLARNDLFNFFSYPLFSHCPGINDSYTIYARDPSC